MKRKQMYLLILISVILVTMIFVGVSDMKKDVDLTSFYMSHYHIVHEEMTVLEECLDKSDLINIEIKIDTIKKELYLLGQTLALYQQQVDHAEVIDPFWENLGSFEEYFESVDVLRIKRDSAYRYKILMEVKGWKQIHNRMTREAEDWQLFLQDHYDYRYKR